MKKIILILLLNISFMINAQNKLFGIITNEQNKPLKGVLVNVVQNNQTVTTNIDGKYSIVLPKSKIATVKFQLAGFVFQEKNIEITKNDMVLDVVLKDIALEMDEVIISTAFNKLQSQNVVKVIHESIKNLQQKGNTTLIEGLATLPGISQISTGTSIGKPVIRGLSGNRVLVYSQGVRLENQQFGDEHGLGLSDSGIESAEIIKGPASLLYGSDALGGVLYFNPEKFAEAKTAKANFSQRYFSNTIGSDFSLGAKASSEKLKFLARGNYTTHLDYKIPEGQKVTNSRYNETDFKTATGYDGKFFSSTLRYNYNKLNIGIPEDGIALQTNSQTPDFPKQNVANHLLSLNNVFYLKKTKLETNLGYISNNRKEYELHSHGNEEDTVSLQEAKNHPVLDMKLKTFNYDLKYYLPKRGKLESVFGIQGMYQTNANFGEEYLIPDASTTDFGVFGTTNYEWKKNTIQGGLRFDNRKIKSNEHGIFNQEGYFQAINKSFTSFNAALGYKTKITNNVVLRLNTATGFRAPNLAELSSNGGHGGTFRYEIGNSNLKTENNIQTDFNIEYKNTHFEFYANAFYNHINRYIYLKQTNEVIDDKIVFAYNQTNATLYGAETGIHLHPHPLDWLHFESNFETVIGKKQNGEYLPMIPANNWNNTLKTEFKIKDFMQEGYFSLTFSSTFSQNKVSGLETQSEGYNLLNAALGGKIKINTTPFELFFNANNLTNKTYIAHLSRLKTSEIPNIGRNFIFGMRFNL